MAELPSLKGHEFTPDSPLVPQSIKDGPPDQLTIYLADETERWRVVRTCDICGEVLVREELEPHRLAHVPDDLRGIARDLASLTSAQRLVVIGLFDTSTGDLLGTEVSV